MGYPLNDVTPTSTGGSYVHFDKHTSIYVNPHTKQAYAVMGSIRDLWQNQGWETGRMGYPLSDERDTTDVGTGRYSIFEGGVVYWTRATGAHLVLGLIRTEYEAQHGSAGPLGYPLTDELPTPDGRGRYSVFQHGSIYWDGTNGRAFTVSDGVRDVWAETGWEQGPLGYPVSNMEAAAANNTYNGSQRFQHGTINAQGTVTMDPPSPKSGGGGTTPCTTNPSGPFCPLPPKCDNPVLGCNPAPWPPPVSWPGL
jgi:uncharacterized protein with LGFP repeats